MSNTPAQPTRREVLAGAVATVAAAGRGAYISAAEHGRLTAELCRHRLTREGAERIREIMRSCGSLITN